MSTWFDRDAVPGGDHPYPSGGVAVAYPKRIPGTHMSPNLKPPPSFTPVATELLEQIVDGLVHLDGPICRPRAEAPVLTETGWPEGVARGLLIGALWDAVLWLGGLDYEGCEDCAAEDGPCRFHAPRRVRVLEYEALHDFTKVAKSDSSALYGVAVAIATGDAALGDIAAPGSPLESLLLTKLAQLDAEAGAR